MGKDDILVEVLERDQHGFAKKPTVKKIRDEHGTLMVSLPKELLKSLGLKLNEEVIIDYKKGSNPLGWEIMIRPIRQSQHID